MVGIMDTQPNQSSFVLRAPRAEECAALSDICMRSKAHWGYDAAFLEACREELTLRPKDLGRSFFCVAADQASDAPLGIAELSVNGHEAMLEAMFIDPQIIGAGLGRALFDWAANEARARGATSMALDADPNAVGFYERMGARQTGFAPSASIAGRQLPRMVFALA